jgi:hypothetical protein
MPTPTILAKKEAAEPYAVGVAGPSPSASPVHPSMAQGEAGLRHHTSTKPAERVSASGKLINEYFAFSYDSAFKVRTNRARPHVVCCARLHQR